MAQIPGKDNYGANIVVEQASTNKLSGIVNDPLTTSGKGSSKTIQALNMGYYNRVYATGKADANGESAHMRGFKDPTLWVAETTNKRVVEFQGRRFSWAIPFEVIYLSPLKNWNPYNLDVKDSKPKGGTGRKNGCRGMRGADKNNVNEVKKCASTFIHKNDYYQTPESLWTDIDFKKEQDAADTSGFARAVTEGMPTRGLRRNVWGWCSVSFPDFPRNVVKS